MPNNSNERPEWLSEATPVDKAPDWLSSAIPAKEQPDWLKDATPVKPSWLDDATVVKPGLSPEEQMRAAAAAAPAEALLERPGQVGRKILEKIAGIKTPILAKENVSVSKQLESARNTISDSIRPYLPEQIASEVAAGAAVAATLPFELAKQFMLPPTLGDAAMNVGALFIPPLKSLAPAARPATALQRANLEAAKESIMAGAEGITAATLGKPRPISVPAPALGEAAPLSRAAVQQQNLEQAIKSATSAELSPAIKTSLDTIENVAGKRVAESAVPRILEQSPNDIVRHTDELATAASGPAPIIKKITNEATTENLTNVIERMGRPKLESETVLLGLKNTGKILETTANELIAAKAAGRVLTQKEGQIATDAVLEGIETGEFSPQVGASMLGYDIGTSVGRVEFMNFLDEASSGSGFALAQMSRMQKAFVQMFKNAPELEPFIKSARLRGVDLRPEGIWDKAMGVLKVEELLRKVGVISHPSTAITNAASQGEFSAFAAYRDGISGMLGVVSGKIPANQMLDLAAADVYGLFSRLKHGEMKEALAAIEKFPFEYRRLLNTASAESVMDSKYTRSLAFLNSLQERFYAAAAADAHMRQTMRLTGKKSLQELTETEIRMAVDHVREMTYSSAPRTPRMIETQRKVAMRDYLKATGKPKAAWTEADLAAATKYADQTVPRQKIIMDKIGVPLMRAYAEFPMLSALGPTFPRFVLNAANRIQSLIPFPLSLFRPSTYEAMASKDPRIAFKALSNSFGGTTYMGAGAAMVGLGVWGDKLMEVKIGDKYYNIDKYASTFASPVLMGRLFTERMLYGKYAMLRYNASDLLKAFTSIRKDDMGKVPIAELWSDDATGEMKAESFMRLMDGFSASLPPRLLVQFPQDILAIGRDEAAKQRYIRERHIIDPILAQVPILSEGLKEYRHPLKEGAIYRGETTMERALRLVGLVGKTKSPIESEVDRLGILPKNLWPRTGLKEWDYAAAEAMGKVAANRLDSLRRSKYYMNFGDDIKLKKIAMETELNAIKSEAEAYTRTGKERNLYSFIVSKGAFDEEMWRRKMEEKGVDIPK